MKENKKKQQDFSQKDELDKIERVLGEINLMVGVDSLEKSFPRSSTPRTGDEKIEEPSFESFLSEDGIQSEGVKPDSQDILSMSQHIRENLRFLIPLPSGEKLSWEKLTDLSVSPQELSRLATEDLSKLAAVEAVPVYPDQIITECDESVKEKNGTLAGAHITYTAQGAYQSQRFGYLSIVEGRLSVISPIIVDASKLHAYLGIFSQKKHKVTTDMLHPWILEHKIKAKPDTDMLSFLFQEISGGIQKKGAYLIASGRQPVHGKDAKIEFLEFQSEKKLTSEPIDHREISSLPTVKKDQLLACRTLKVKAIAGINVYGKPIPVKPVVDHVLKAGKNVRIDKKIDREYFYAVTSGVVKVRGGCISVDKVLILPIGINYKTGNIRFDGDVFITGSVLEGFKLIAEGDITITDSVLDGAWVVSEGSITVEKGIVGKKTNVSAGGSVHALYVNDSKVRANGNIVLQSYAYNAHLFALGRISIYKGQGRRGGSIVGGRAIALAGMDTWIAGSDSWIATQLTTGFDPEKYERLERVEGSIVKSNTFLAKILELFAIPQLDADLIAQKISAATGEQRKILVYHAKLLGQIVTSHKILLEMRKKLQLEMLAIPQGTEIEIRKTAHPEVLLRIGPYALKISEETGAATFMQGETSIIKK